MGPFFWRLRKDFEDIGARVAKINFCPADTLFYPCGATTYRGTLADWPVFLEDTLSALNVDAIFLFGDCRPYHAVAREVAYRRGVELFVFEEGYLRPDYITIERGGVNKHSSVPRNLEAFSMFEYGALSWNTQAFQPRHAFLHMSVYAMVYSVVNALGGWLFPHYAHHRPLHPVREACAWVRGGFRKHWFLARERELMKRFTAQLSGRYFLVPLQVHNDAQVTTHSGFGSVEEFIATVVESFARYGEPRDAIVFKHHPMDRAYREYGQLMAELTRSYGLEGRLYYVHDLHLPTLLDHARGTVVINSTAGLSSLLHGTPVITLGDPIYNLPGLAFQGTLEQFWREPGTFDTELHQRFRNWLLAYNQANGNFYKPLTDINSHTGVAWPTLGAETARKLGYAGPVTIPSRVEPLTRPATQVRRSKVA